MAAVRGLLGDREWSNTRLKLGYTGTVDILDGDDGILDLREIGCLKDTPREQADCAVQVLAPILAIDGQEGLAEASGVYPLHFDRTAVTYTQYIDGVAVSGSRMTLIIDNKKGRLDALVSSWLLGLETRSPNERQANQGSTSAEVDGLVPESHEVERLDTVYYVDRVARSSEAILAHRVTTTIQDGANYVSYHDAETGEILKRIHHTRNWADPSLLSSTHALDYITPTSPPTCPTGYAYSQGTCVLIFPLNAQGVCPSDQLCEDLFDAPYSCLDEPSEHDYAGYCASEAASIGDRTCLHVWSESSGWEDPGAATFFPYRVYSDIADRLNDWMGYDLQIFSWDNCPPSSSDCPSCDPADFSILWKLNHVSEAASSYGGDGEILVQIHPPEHYFDSDAALSSHLLLLGHEMGHSICMSANFEPGPTPDACAKETLVEMFGALFAASQVSGDFETLSSARQTAFRDESWGNLTGCPQIPYLEYAHRYVYDDAPCSGVEWTGVSCNDDSDCGPWESCQVVDLAVPAVKQCNTAVNNYQGSRPWRRFLRLWAMGTDSLDEDGLGEYMGFSFAGAGLTNATTIFSDIVQSGRDTTARCYGQVGCRAPCDLPPENIFETGTMEDLADLLVTFSPTYLKDTTRYALGAIGIPSLFTTNVEVANPAGPAVAIEYTEYTGSENKRVTAWVDTSAYVNVSYYSGSTLTTDTWYGGAVGSPVVAGHNGLLYVFWKDSAGYIHWKRYLPSGYSFGPYDGTALGFRTWSFLDFDAVSHDGNLYLIFNLFASLDLYFSKCTSSTCTASTTRWTNWSGEYFSHLKDDAIGPSSVSMKGLNGLPGTLAWAQPSLYVAYAGTPGGEIRVARVDETDTIAGEAVLDASGPSSYTGRRLALAGRYSAFVPDTPTSQRTHLYLAWTDGSYSADEDLYLSVLQRWDGSSAGQSHWYFTRPRDLRIVANSATTFTRYSDDERQGDRVELQYLQDGVSSSATIFGRY